MADLTIPQAKQKGQQGHVQVHTDLRQGLLDAEGRLDALEAGGAVNTNASNLTSGTLAYARLPGGSVINVDYYIDGPNAWPGARPTSRTDIQVVWTGPSDPGSLKVNRDVWHQTV